MGFDNTYLWVDPIYTGVVFATVLVTLVSVCYHSLISVVAYTSIALLLLVATTNLYVYVMVTLLKKDMANPVEKFAGVDIEMSADWAGQMASGSAEKVNAASRELRRLFMVDNVLDSVKFGLSMWALTYVGSWFNAITLFLIFWVGLFTGPKVYLNNKAQIDPVLDQVRAKYVEVSAKITAMIPQAKLNAAAAAATETKKEE